MLRRILRPIGRWFVIDFLVRIFAGDFLFIHYLQIALNKRFWCIRALIGSGNL